MSALLQYRKESLSPEYGQRNLQALARSEVSKQKEPKVVYARDERYLEITEWKPVSCCMHFPASPDIKENLYPEWSSSDESTESENENVIFVVFFFILL